MNNAPIGIFDSGIGGLSVRRMIAEVVPNESIIYYGDGKNCPYGGKTEEELCSISDGIIAFLRDRGVKLVVLACNSATAAAVDFLRSKYDIPIVGMEPAVKPAALSTRSGVIGVLATEATFRGRLYKETSAKYSDNVRIIPVVGAGFVELVEGDRENTREAYETVKKVVEPLIAEGVDKIVLGCTHYAFLKDNIERVIAGRNIDIIDPAPAIAHRVEEVLCALGLEAERDNVAEYTYCSSAGEDYIKRLIAKDGKQK